MHTYFKHLIARFLSDEKVSKNEKKHLPNNARNGNINRHATSVNRSLKTEQERKKTKKRNVNSGNKNSRRKRCQRTSRAKSNGEFDPGSG